MPPGGRQGGGSQGKKEGVRFFAHRRRRFPATPAIPSQHVRHSNPTEGREKGKKGATKVKRMVSIAWDRKQATATYEYGPKVRIQGFHYQLRHSIDGKERIA